jgi:DNA-directed RNA polymerase specialized sigma24 family protein
VDDRFRGIRAASDRELWQRAGDGDSTAFGEIFERHAKAVYNHLFRRISDWSQAEDLTSAVFLHAWRRRSTEARRTAGSRGRTARSG